MKLYVRILVLALIAFVFSAESTKASPLFPKNAFWWTNTDLFMVKGLPHYECGTVGCHAYMIVVNRGGEQDIYDVGISCPLAKCIKWSTIATKMKNYALAPDPGAAMFADYKKNVKFECTRGVMEEVSPRGDLCKERHKFFKASVLEIIPSATFWDGP